MLFETEKAWPRLPGRESRGPAFQPQMHKEVRLHLKAIPNQNDETYQVTADGEELTCEPAEQLPLAQKYFLF